MQQECRAKSCPPLSGPAWTPINTIRTVRALGLGLGYGLVSITRLGGGGGGGGSTYSRGPFMALQEYSRTWIVSTLEGRQNDRNSLSEVLTLGWKLEVVSMVLREVRTEHLLTQVLTNRVCQ